MVWKKATFCVRVERDGREENGNRKWEKRRKSGMNEWKSNSVTTGDSSHMVRERVFRACVASRAQMFRGGRGERTREKSG